MLRVAPDTENLVVGQIGRVLCSGEAMLTVVSDAYVGLRLAVLDALHVLAQGCPLDPDVLRAGICARTLLARVTVLIVRNENESFDLWVERSHERHLRGRIGAGA